MSLRVLATFWLLVGAVLLAGADAGACAACDRSRCTKATGCYAGVVMDTCQCCAVCGRREGELCTDPALISKHNVLTEDGRCGENLHCQLVEANNTKRAVCVCKEEDMVCGSDSVTYDNLCQLMEIAYRNATQFAPKVETWGPCESAPVIVSGPIDAHLPAGAEFSADCEVRGFPVPEVLWERITDDGISALLPGYSQDVAVQTRGGPTRVMLTSWVQIAAVKPTDSGRYDCVARNKYGEARAAARVGVYRGIVEGDVL